MIFTWSNLIKKLACIWVKSVIRPPSYLQHAISLLGRGSSTFTPFYHVRITWPLPCSCQFNTESYLPSYWSLVCVKWHRSIARYDLISSSNPPPGPLSGLELDRWGCFALRYIIAKLAILRNQGLQTGLKFTTPSPPGSRSPLLTLNWSYNTGSQKIVGMLHWSFD